MSVLHVTTEAETVLLAMIVGIAALVAAVIGIVDQLLTGAATVTAGQRRIAVVTVIEHRHQTVVVTVTNGIADRLLIVGVTATVDRPQIVGVTVIVRQPQIAAVTGATTVTGDLHPPATEAETVIADQLLTGAAIVTEIVVATVTEGQIVEVIAAPQIVDGIAATASPHA